MDRLLKSIIAILLFSQALGLFGQDSTSVVDALDDNNLSAPKVVFKIHPSAALVGDIPVSAEFVIFRRISLQAGVGIIGPFGIDFLRDMSDMDEQNVKSGYSWRVQPRIYLSKKKAPYGAYLAIQYRHRRFVCEPDYFFPYDKATHSDFTFGGGAQWFYKRRISFDLGWLIGSRVAKWWEPGAQVPKTTIRLAPSFDFAVGFRI